MAKRKPPKRRNLTPLPEARKAIKVEDIPRRQSPVLVERFVTGLVDGKTKKEAAIQAGIRVERASDQASQLLKTTEVRECLAKHLDRAGASLEESARVLGDAHKAEKVIRSRDGKEVDREPDHRTRLEAVNTALRARGINKEGEEGGNTFNFTQVAIKINEERVKRGLEPL